MKMYLYNLTIHIEWLMHDRFLSWLQSEVIPSLMEKTYFQSYKFFELLGTDEKEGRTYSLQLFAESIGGYNRFAEIYQDRFFRAFVSKWGESCYIFPTLLHQITTGSDR